MNIKQSTLDAIKDSKVIMVSFDKYGSITKISMTYHDSEYVYTVNCFAKITFNKELRTRGYAELNDILKPSEFSANRINKATGDETFNNEVTKTREVFKAICKELSNRTDTVYLDMYQSFTKKA